MKAYLFHTRQRGQRAVAMVFFLLVFGLTLSFTMVVFNTGLIVHQKIRLQTATDLAAYAGASVQASYLGNESSGQESLTAINDRIVRRYIRLLEEINDHPNRVIPAPPIIPASQAACMAACAAANLAVANRALSIYRRALSDIDEEHIRVRRMLEQLPSAIREAMETTVALNIPELSLEDGPFGGATNDLTEIIDQPLQNFSADPRNINLSFHSDKAFYLANIVAGVPHRLVYFGPNCANMNRGLDRPPVYYCTVNGQGGQGTAMGFQAAVSALALAMNGIGNLGSLESIASPNSRAIKLQFIEDPHRPSPFVVAATEWFPKTGGLMNLEKSFGARGKLIPDHTRLGAISAAEPFGGYLANQQVLPFGVRLQAIRKLLLDPRMLAAREDFGGLYDYMEYVGPKDERGESIESAEETILRFLH
ncbi:MAG: hypothetical protein EA369_05470 [Bradymonadales bacterium]|nr:MAG: hypothetical protein EA369_05470 [Bradymonadales bacterium]